MRRLQADGVDVAAAIEQGRYIALDAGDAISTFMVDGMFEPVRFLEIFGELIVKAASAAGGEHPRVALFGECPDLLWKRGNPEAAIQDEKLGNRLLKTYDVDILCGYSLDSLDGEMGSYAFDKICGGAFSRPFPLARKDKSLAAESIFLSCRSLYTQRFECPKGSQA